jgi:hypothetical protein
MNNWCFYCFLLFVDDRVESTRAKLIIPPPIVTPTYSISSQSNGTALAIISSTLPLSTHFSTLVSTSIPLHTTPVLENTKGSSSQFILVPVSVAAVVVVIPVSALIFALFI